MKTYSAKTMANALAALLFSVLVLAACSQDETAPTTEQPAAEHTVTMVLQAACPHFDVNLNTRATDADWPDGSKVYMQLRSADKNVRGEAVYSAAADEWTMNYAGDLQPGAGSGEAYYMGNARTTNTGVELSAQSEVYRDFALQYSFDGNRLVVAASLTPRYGRIRFKAQQADELVIVSGLKWPTAYNAARNMFTESEQTVVLRTVADDNGDCYTPYVYATFADDTQRQLTLSTPADAFSQTFPASVLAVGESGFVDVPTATNLRGWKTADPFAALSIADSISEERQQIISDFIDNMVKVTSKPYNFGGETGVPVIVSPFFIAKTELTQRVYNAVMNTTFQGESSTDTDPDKPVFMHGDSEYDTDGTKHSLTLPSEGYTTYITRPLRQFVDKLNLLTNLHFDHPTEAEWEYAARGGQNMRGYYTYAGSTTTSYSDVAQSSYTTYGVSRVGQKQPNELGLFDMTGNASEVCYYIGDMNNTALVVDPQCYDNNFCFRGGTSYDVYYSASSYATISNRLRHAGTTPARSYYGLRLVLRYVR